MENKYKELFEKIAPQRSDEELLNAVLDRKAVNMNEKKKFSRKAVIISAAAAAMLLCTTVGVSAAYAWDIPGALSGIFDKSPKASNGESNFEFNDFNFAEFGGKILNQRFERNGYAVQMKGVVADMHSALIFYDIILDEDHVSTPPHDNGNGYTYTKGDEVYVTMWEDSYFDLVHEYLDQNRNPDGTYNFDNYLKMDSEYENIMLEKEENVIHCVHRNDLKILSFKDKEIVYQIKGLHANKCDGTYFNDRLENDDILTIKFDFIKENDDITVDGNEPFSLSSGEYGAITSVHITSLSLDISIEWDNGPKYYTERAYNELNVRFKDGTVAGNDILSYNSSGHFDSDGGGMLSQELLLNWKYPVKTADIDAIIIGDTEFKVG